MSDPFFIFLKGTLKRRDHLNESKFFWCTCERCKLIYLLAANEQWKHENKISFHRQGSDGIRHSCKHIAMPKVHKWIYSVDGLFEPGG